MSALLLAAATLSGAEAAERRYALLIGANRGDASEAVLKYAQRDAERVSEVLQTFGGIAPADVVLLKDPDAATVRESIKSLEARIEAETTEDDRTLIFVYYSGHADASDLHLGGSRFSLAELKRRVTDSHADLQLLVVDACRAAELTRLKGATPAEPFAITVNNTSTQDGMAIITAAAPGEDAQESDRYQGGVFTHHFIAGLQGAADSSGDHLVTLNEAYSYSHARTLITTSSERQIQNPSKNFELRGQGELVLTQLDGARRVGYLSLTEPGTYVVFDPKGSAIFNELEVTAGARFALAEGTYLLRKRTPARVYQTTISIAQGQTSTVSTSQMRQLPYGQTARRGDTTERHFALGVIGGGGLESSLTESLPQVTSGYLGARLELPVLTLDARARYGTTSADNSYLTLSQTNLAAEVSAYRYTDIWRVSLGAGLRAGGLWAQQSFDTPGEAPDNDTFSPYVSPLLRGEVSLTPRMSLGLESGVSSYLLPEAIDGSEETTLTTTTVPHASLDLTVFLF